MADEVTIRVVRSFQEISSSEWGLLSGASRSSGGYNPFTSHAFLSALEESGSATAETGWMGHHLLLEEHRHDRCDEDACGDFENVGAARDGLHFGLIQYSH